MLDELTVVFPTYHSPDYARIVIRSFERFKPAGMRINYIVVENSDDASYKDETLACANDVIWIQNPLDMLRFPQNAKHSFANAEGVIRGLSEVTTKWVFIAHSDVCVTSSSFFEELQRKIDEGHVLVGTVKDNGRVKAIHVSGYLTLTDLTKSIKFYPWVTQGQHGQDVEIKHDVGDELDLLCRKHGFKTFCYSNTENGHPLTDDVFAAFPVDRCMDSNGKVMFMHLGRGADKLAGRYTKQGRVLVDRWVDFCKQFT